MRFSMVSAQKDSLNNVLMEENKTLSGIITDQVSQQALLNDQIKRINKKTFWVKVERDAAVIVLLFVGGYATLKQ